MSSSTPMLRFVALLGLVLLPARASAHTSLRHLALRRSDPAQGSSVAPPTRIALWFTARPERAFSHIRLVGPAGDIALGTPASDSGNGLYARVPQRLEPGAYRVEWQTASADGHPIRGEFTFAVVSLGVAPAAGTSDRAAHAGHESAPQMRRDDSSFRTARWFEFAALLTVLGVLGFRHGVLPPLAARAVPTADAADRARRLGLSMLLLYAMAAVIRLYTQMAVVRGPGASGDMNGVRALVTQSLWGVGWTAGVFGAAIVIVGWLISKRTVAIGTPLALTGALGMVLSPALSGHAASNGPFVLSVTLDMLHVIAVGVWLGGLAMVLFAGIPAMLRLGAGNTHAAVSALVNSFHPIALFCAPVAIVSGIGSGWLRIGGFAALWSTEYGKTLLWKVLFVAVVLGMGTYNSTRVRRRLAGGDVDATRSFRRTGAIELAFGALVLVITTLLVVTPAPTDLPSP